MISKKKTAKILIKYVFNPNLVFFIYFAIIALIGLIGKQKFLILLLVLPWVSVILLFFYLPFLSFLFNVPNMEVSTKINHVLEHGTIYFLKEHCGKKCRIGGSALNEGFRLYGDMVSKQDINDAFEELKLYLSKGKNAAVLSKLCGSNIPILGGISFVMLTITALIFLVFDLELNTIRMILLVNIILYFILRYPIGKLFQKKVVMYFEFGEPKIISIEKVKKREIWEKNPVYFVKTNYKMQNT